MLELQQDIETPITEDVVQETVVEDGGDKGAAVEVQKEPATLRDSIKSAIKDAEERVRDEGGRFKKKEGAAPKEVLKSEEVAEAQTKTIPAPESWKPEAKAKWASIPQDLQNEILRREEEVHRGFTKLDEDRNFGKQMKDVVTPYIAMIQAEGGTPITAVNDLLKTAYALRTGTPEQKGQLLLQVARQFGANLNIESQDSTPQNPELLALKRELEALRSERQSEVAQRTTQQQEWVNQQIAAFAANPKNVHFEKVKARMAALLSGGAAKDLQDAYDQAIYADPEIRSTLIESQQAEAKRLAEIKAKSETAKKAGSSVKGGPGIAVPNTGIPNRSLREELMHNFNSHIN